MIDIEGYPGIVHRLIQLGVREEYPSWEEVTLSSGIKTRVFWNIKKLFSYPPWVRERAIESFIWQIGKLCPNTLMGICTGGLMLANDIQRALGILHRPPCRRQHVPGNIP